MLSVKDDHSRMILAADIRNTMTTDDTLEIMERTTRMEEGGDLSNSIDDHLAAVLFSCLAHVEVSTGLE